MRFFVGPHPRPVIRLNRDRTNHAGPYAGISVGSLELLPHDIDGRIGILNQNLLISP
jgi:hypothetical protein